MPSGGCVGWGRLVEVGGLDDGGVKLSGGDGGDGGNERGVGGVPVVVSRLSEKFQELREEVTRLLFFGEGRLWVR